MREFFFDFSELCLYAAFDEVVSVVKPHTADEGFINDVLHFDAVSGVLRELFLKAFFLLVREGKGACRCSFDYFISVVIQLFVFAEAAGYLP